MKHEGVTVGDNVMQEGDNGVEEGVVQDNNMMNTGVTTTQKSVMQSSDTFGKLGCSIVRELNSIHDEIEQAIDVILQVVNFQNKNKTQSNTTNGEIVVEDNDVIEFTKGRKDDILLKKIQLGLVDIVYMLEAGYRIAKIEAMPGVQLELDDSPPVKLVRYLSFFS